MAAHLLFEHEIGIAVQVGAPRGNVVLEFLDACLLVGLLLVVVGFFLHEALDRLGRDDERGRGRHILVLAERGDAERRAANGTVCVCFM